MPRPGFVLDVDRSTPPILFHHGEQFRLEKLPPGRSRVIYPAEPLPAIDDVEGAIRDALCNPLGDSEPLPALLRPGMKLTIAFDDISLPLPPMRSPDIRQRIIEQVLDMAAAAGVDDVHLIAALALHRRMTEAELRHAVGDRVYDAFAPHGLLYNHDAEDPDNLAYLGTTDQGEEVEINKRAAESDLIVYVNINLVAMDGGWKSTATGLASYRSLRHHHNVHTLRHSRSFMDRHSSELHHSNWRMGKVLRDSGVKVFQIETTLNNDTFGADGPLSVLVPSFLLSELSRAFEVGFVIFLPFLIIDLVVAAVLMSMGMMMVPPAVVSLPFKLAFFVVADGWTLVSAALVRGYF